MDQAMRRYFLNNIENIENHILNFRFYKIDENLNLKSSSFEKENQYWKYILFQLDEIKINIKNNRYFDFKNIIENKIDYPDNPADFHYNFKKQQTEIERLFDDYIKNQLINNKLFKIAISNHNSFIDRLKEYPNLYKEMVNIMLSSKDTINFDDAELEDHNGFSAKSIYEETDGSMPLRTIYDWLIKIEKAPVEASAFLNTTIKNLKNSRKISLT